MSLLAHMFKYVHRHKQTHTHTHLFIARNEQNKAKPYHSIHSLSLFTCFTRKKYTKLNLPLSRAHHRLSIITVFSNRKLSRWLACFPRECVTSSVLMYSRQSYLNRFQSISTALEAKTAMNGTCAFHLFLT